MWWRTSSGAIIHVAQIRALYIADASGNFGIYADLTASDTDVLLNGTYATEAAALDALVALTQYFDPASLV